MSDRYLTPSATSRLLGVHCRTLYVWESKGQIDVIRTPGGKRLYNIGKYLESKKIVKNENIKEVVKRKKIIYARVSSKGQADDLKRQKEELMKLYPTYEVIEDIGSGLNLTKRGLKRIIDLGINGKIEEVVVMHKDRLARFGYDLIEHIIKKYSKGKITIVKEELGKEPEEELVSDVLQIMNVFVAKMNGRRRLKKSEAS